LHTILVTGGAGFVGSSLAISIKQDLPGLRVICLDNLKRRGSELNIPRLGENGVEFRHCDIRNPEDIDEVGPFDVMLECSAEPSVMAGVDGSPTYLINTNLIGTLNCLEAVRKHGAKIIFLSTSRVYPVGAISELPFKEGDTRFTLMPDVGLVGVTQEGIAEDFPLEGSRTLYGFTKLASELAIQEYVEIYGIEAVINRCGVLSGAWQMGKVDQGFMVFWVAQHMFGSKLTYFGFGGRGKQVRDVLHVNDLYRLLRIQMDDFPSYNGHVYNVGGGFSRSVSLFELTLLIQEVTGRSIEMRGISESRRGDIPWYITDNSRVTAATGWGPRISLQEIVGEIVEWISTNETMLKQILL